jgi:predicted enzyme related to lactoylglutathione lyase
VPDSSNQRIGDIAVNVEKMNHGFPIAAIMVHVADVREAMAWYQSAFPAAVPSRAAETDFEFLLLDGVRLEFVPADDKVSSGPCGTVVYWNVSNFEQTPGHFVGIGAKLYRGPLNIEGAQSICQVQDPWGNCIGLRGRTTGGP